MLLQSTAEAIANEADYSVDRRAILRAKRLKRPKAPTHSSNVVNGLQRKYQLLLGEIKKLESAEYEWSGIDGYELAERWWRDRLGHLHSTLATLETSIRLFDPKWDRTRMVPKVANSTDRLLPRNKLQGAIARSLQKAVKPLTVAEIVAQIATYLELPLNRRDQRQRLWVMVYGSLQGYKDKGLVDCKGSPAKWFVVARTSQEDGGLLCE